MSAASSADSAARADGHRLAGAVQGREETPNVVHLDRRAGGAQRCGDAGIAAHVAVEQGLLGEHVGRASRLLAERVGVLQEQVVDRHAARHHVELHVGRILRDAERELLDREVLRRQARGNVGVPRRRHRRRHRRQEARAGLGDRLAEAGHERLAVGDCPEAEPGGESLTETALQEALLDDRLDGAGEIVQGHLGSL